MVDIQGTAIHGTACPHCGTHNNFHADAAAIAAQCGRCDRRLFEGKAYEVGGDAFLAHSLASDPPPGKIPLLLVCFGVGFGVTRINADRYAKLYEPNLRVLKINAFEHHEALAGYAVRAVPTGLLFQAGTVVARALGAPIPEADPFARMLDEHGVKRAVPLRGAPAAEA